MMRTFHALAFVALSLVVSTATAQAPQVIPGDLLVMLRSDGSAQKVAEDLAVFNGTANGLHVEREVSASMRAWLLRFDPQRADQAVLLRAVRNHPHVQLAQNNHHLTLREVPNDERFGDQWHHQNINSEAAWDISTGGLTADGDTIVVCIIENCNLPHADLIANAWINHEEIPDNGVDDDANGYADDYRGWSPNNDDDEVYGGSHGTQVAGMIGATGDNEVGVVGANWTVKMMVVSNSGASDAGVIASHTYPLIMRRMYNETNGEKEPSLWPPTPAGASMVANRQMRRSGAPCTIRSACRHSQLRCYREQFRGRGCDRRPAHGLPERFHDQRDGNRHRR